MSNELDLQDKTRMLDVYKDLESIIDQISKLPVFPPLVWVWTWDVAKTTLRDFGLDNEYQVNCTELELFEKFWKDADKNAFSLEYGSEDLYEAVRAWMIDSDIVSFALDGEEEDMLESEAE